MKYLHREINISYDWWRQQNLDIPQDHVSYLEQRAKYRIIAMMKECYVSGELFESILDYDDQEIEYSGRWSITNEEGE